VAAAGARKYSDVLSARQWHRLGLYRETAQPLGVEDMFRLWLEPKLVARGWTNAQIASSLWIARGTVRKHLDNICDKLGVQHTRTAAVAALREQTG
jgi:ATP/maltotriose-dependent transcriptional regulator MalT